MIADWHGKGRNHVAITPRFAITSTPEQMEAAAALAREFPDLHIQTHLSENHDEIKFTCELYPDAIDYTDIYARYGLLGPKSLFGHCIHLSEREADAMSEAGSIAVHCPTSNLFLGSGLFPLKTLARREKPVRIGVATDIGGGSSYSMLRTMDEAYKIQQLARRTAEPAGELLLHDARQRRGAVARGQDRHAGARHRRRSRRPRTLPRRRPWR